jgi:hypothetical protein
MHSFVCVWLTEPAPSLCACVVPLLFWHPDGETREYSNVHCWQTQVSGSDDGTLRMWEVDTGRCFRKVRPPSVCVALFYFDPSYLVSRVSSLSLVSLLLRFAFTIAILARSHCNAALALARPPCLMSNS